VRRVAVVAYRYLPVARLDPAVVLLVHDVAVGAGTGVVREIRRPASVDERNAYAYCIWRDPTTRAAIA
jgi:hypothetical protein